MEHKGIVERAGVFSLATSGRSVGSGVGQNAALVRPMFDAGINSKKFVPKGLSQPLYVEGIFVKHASTSRNARVAVRLTREEQRQVEEAAKTRGYANPSAFIRAAIRNELEGRVELTGTDERIGAGFDRVSHDIFRIGRGQQALFALVDAFAKAVLTCVPEPPPDARSQAIARAKDRYDRLVKSAGQAMSGDARAAMKDLVDHGTN